MILEYHIQYHRYYKTMYCTKIKMLSPCLLTRNIIYIDWNREIIVIIFRGKDGEKHILISI